MTGPQIARLMAVQKSAPTTTTGPATVPAPTPGIGPPTLPVPPLAAAPPPAPLPVPPGAAVGGLAPDESPVQPTVPEEIPQRVLDPAAAWAADVGAVAGGTRLEPRVALRINLTFDEARAGLDHTEAFEAVLPVNARPDDLQGLQAVDHDDRDFRTDLPDGAVYVLPEAKIATKAWWAAVQRAVREELLASRSMTVLHNETLKLWSRPAETREAFAARCRVVADEREDVEAEKVRRSFVTKADRIHAALDRAQDKVAQLQADVSTRRSTEMVNIGSSILGGFLGGRRSGRGVAADLRRAASNRGQTRRTRQRLDTAQDGIVDATDDLTALEEELASQLLDIDHRWMEASGAITEVEVGLEKSDVTVVDVMLVWVPTTR
ncbi:MAG TPA: hypothetical protein VMM13_20240, partial [Euzebya sp.]|nr:hypothetical protein [Euzebya sp.]